MRQHNANQTQRLFVLERTNDHNSSNSNTSGSSRAAGARVCANGGSCCAFFEPGANGSAGDTEDAGEAPQGRALMVGSQNLLLARLIIGGTAWVLARGPCAITAAIALLAVRGFAMADEIGATTVTAAYSS